MPDIETLMAAWPPEMEDVLRATTLPSEDLAVSTSQLARVMCALLDVPVYGSITESLHVLFTLFLEFKNNPFLAAGRARGAYEAPPASGESFNEQVSRLPGGGGQPW